MKLLKTQKIFNKTKDFPPLVQGNRLQQEFLIESDLRLKRQGMSALGSPNPVRKAFHIFRARSQPNSLIIPNVIFNTLRIESSVDIAEELNIYLSSTLTIDNPLHSKIHLASVRLSLTSFYFAGIRPMVKCAKPSHRPGLGVISPVLFYTADPDRHLLPLNPFSLSVFRANFPLQWKVYIIVPHQKRVLHMTHRTCDLLPTSQLCPG